MQVTILHPPLNLAERAAEANKAPARSGGTHVSALVRSRAFREGIVKGQKAMGGKFKAEMPIDESDFPLVIALGLAWEDWLSQQYPDMIYHIGEITLDGVAGSPDGLTPLPDSPEYAGLGDAVVEEFKLTYKSGRQPIQDNKFKAWLWQIMAYCKMLGVLCARLHVLFLFGEYDYSKEGLPTLYRVFCLQFTQEELDGNWAALMREKDGMLDGPVPKEPCES